MEEVENETDAITKFKIIIGKIVEQTQNMKSKLRRVDRANILSSSNNFGSCISESLADKQKDIIDVQEQANCETTNLHNELLDEKLKVQNRSAEVETLRMKLDVFHVRLI